MTKGGFARGVDFTEAAPSGLGSDRAMLGLAILFAFLLLVGLCESWMIRVSVLFSVPVGVLRAFIEQKGPAEARAH